MRAGRARPGEGRLRTAKEACGKCGHQKADAHTSHRLGTTAKGSPESKGGSLIRGASGQLVRASSPPVELASPDVSNTIHTQPMCGSRPENGPGVLERNGLQLFRGMPLLSPPRARKPSAGPGVRERPEPRRRISPRTSKKEDLRRSSRNSDLSRRSCGGTKKLIKPTKGAPVSAPSTADLAPRSKRPTRNAHRLLPGGALYGKARSCPGLRSSKLGPSPCTPSTVPA